MPNLFEIRGGFLNGSVGNNHDNDPQDVLRTKRNFKALGLYSGDETAPYIDHALTQTIRSFQKQNNLRVDGFMEPDGETEKMMHSLITNGKSLAEEAMSQHDPDNVFENIKMVSEKQEKKEAPKSSKKPGREILDEKRKLSAKNSADVFEEFFKNLKEKEGGISNRSKEADPGGLTNQGVSTRFYKDYINENWNEYLPKNVTELSEEKRKEIFKSDFFVKTQIDKLVPIAGYDKTSSRLVEHVFDANVMTDPVKVGRWLQQSIDETIGTDTRVTEKNGEKTYDGILGSKTREALKQAVEEKKIQDVHERFTNKRIDYLRGLQNYKANPGWEKRVNSFKEQP